MSIGSAIRQGWIYLRTFGSTWWVWYACNLAIGLLTLWPLRRWLEANAGHSLAIEAYNEIFDFTFLSDLILHTGSAIAALWTHVLIFGLIYQLLTVFLSGATLFHFIHTHRWQGFRYFIDAGMRMFGPMIRLTCLFVLVQLLLFLALMMVLLAFGLNPMEVRNDSTLVRTISASATVWIFCVIVVSVAHTCAKVALVREQERAIWKAFLHGFRSAFERFGALVILLGFCGLLLAILFILDQLLKANVSVPGISGVLVLLIAGQLVIFARIGVRLLFLGSTCGLVAGAVAEVQDDDR